VSRGMQRNVAVALGFHPPEHVSAEGASCARCGSPVEFYTDAIGFLIERCSGGCAHRRVTPNGDVMRSIADKRRLEEAKAEARTGKTHYECKNPKCGKLFIPDREDRQYCSRACGGLASRKVSGNNQTSLGLMGGVRLRRAT